MENITVKFHCKQMKNIIAFYKTTVST